MLATSHDRKTQTLTPRPPGREYYERNHPGREARFSGANTSAEYQERTRAAMNCAYCRCSAAGVVAGGSALWGRHGSRRTVLMREVCLLEVMGIRIWRRRRRARATRRPKA